MGDIRMTEMTSREIKNIFASNLNVCCIGILCLKTEKELPASYPPIIKRSQQACERCAELLQQSDTEPRGALGDVFIACRSAFKRLGLLSESNEYRDVVEAITRRLNTTSAVLEHIHTYQTLPANKKDSDIACEMCDGISTALYIKRRERAFERRRGYM